METVSMSTILRNCRAGHVFRELLAGFSGEIGMRLLMPSRYRYARRASRQKVWRPVFAVALRIRRWLPVVFFAEQVGHDVDAGVARVVEARQAEAGLEGLQDGEAGVVVVALNTFRAVVGLDGEDDAVLVL
jgi:hypothetical protein